MRIRLALTFDIERGGGASDRESDLAATTERDEMGEHQAPRIGFGTFEGDE